VQLGLNQRARYWKERAAIIREAIETRAWSDELGRYTAVLDGDGMDASLLQLVEIGYAAPHDPRMAATIVAVERELRRGPYMLRYAAADDFGEPETAFNICTFWLIEGLHFTGRTDEARELFEEMLGRRTAAGLLSEDIAFDTGELWGNYPQTYSLVGLINCAGLLSKPWTSVR
jgi:GH15 family glucan-1,4-alpha-glucosidase